MASERAVVEGIGLHGGRRSRVVLARHPGAVLLRTARGSAPLQDLRVASTERATTVRSVDGEVFVASVEHLFAALGGLGLHGGIAIEVEGDELPLLDGGARRWCKLLGELGVASSPPRLSVARDGQVDVGESRYTFARADGVEVRARVVFGDERVDREVAWHGDAEDFFVRFAPARTFAFARELEVLAARGLASHVEAESVVVIGEREAWSAGAPFSWDEPARHKLLDLVGDLYLYGGPPRGRLTAFRPGHGVTHAAIREALARRILVREDAIERVRI